MLGRFRVRNRGPYLEQADLNLAASHYREHSSHKLYPGGNHPPLLRCALLIGANGSGKSTLVEAMRFFRDLVIRTPDPEGGMNTHMFREGGDLKDPTASYTWSFYCQEVRYRYKLTLSPFIVQTETLYRIDTRPGTNGISYYRRWNVDDLVRAHPIRPQIEKVEHIRALHRMAAAAPLNGALLTHAEEEGLDHLVPLLDYFRRSVRIIPGPDEVGLMDILAARPGSDFHRYLLKHLAVANAGAALEGAAHAVAAKSGAAKTGAAKSGAVNTGMANTGMAKKGANSADAASREDGRLQAAATADSWIEYLMQKARVSNTADMLTEGLAWYMQQLACIYEAHRRNKLLIIDGLDRGLHPRLSRNLLKCCLEPSRSGQPPIPSRAQFIITVHDPLLLDQSLLRRDEVWLADKDANSGTSRLINLKELRVRNDLRLDRAYLEGRLGM